MVSGGTDLNVDAIDSAFAGGTFSINGTDSIGAGRTAAAANPATTRINLGAFYTAFATEIGQDFSDTNTYSIGLFNGNTAVGTTFNSGNTASLFFGVTSTTSFDNVRVTTLTGKNRRTLFDNVRVGNAVGAPEPGSLALLGTGIVPLAGVVLRRRRTAKTAA